MMNEGGPVRPTINPWKWVAIFIGALGGLYSAFKLPGDVAQHFQANPVLATYVGLGLVFALLAFFIGFWLWELFKDYVKDNPYPPLSVAEADVFRDLAREIQPNLPDRRRNRVVMGTGIGASAMIVESVATHIQYLTDDERALGTLSREIDRESDFTVDAYRRLSEMVADVIWDIEFFQQRMESWLVLIQRLSPNDSDLLELGRKQHETLSRILQEVSTAAVKREIPANSTVAGTIKALTKKQREDLKSQCSKWSSDVKACRDKLENRGNSLRTISDRLLELLVNFS